MPTALLIEPANGVPASVTPRWSGYGTSVGEHPVGADHRRHVRRLDRDLEVAVVELLEDLDLLERLHDERLGRVLARELLEVLRQRAGVGADPHRDARALRRLDDLLGLVRAADVAGVDPHRRDAGVDRLERERGVEMDVRDHRDRRQADDQRQRLRVLELRHRDADDLAARRRERGDLRRRRLDVVRLRERHRLDDDRRAAADRDAADPDLVRARHRQRQVYRDDVRRARALPPTHRGARAAARRPPRRPLGASAPTSSRARSLAAYRLGLFPMPLDGRLGWFSPAQRAVVPLEPLRASRSLRRARRRYEIRVDTAFGAVVDGLRAAGRARRAGSTTTSSPRTAAARARLGAFGRGVGRRGARRRALRRRDRRSVRRRVDVPRAHRRVEGRVRRARRAAPRGRRRRPPAARRPVADAAPRVARRRRGHAGRLSRADWRGAAVPDASAPSFDSARRSTLGEPADVVREADDEQQQDEPDPDDRDALVDLPCGRCGRGRPPRSRRRCDRRRAAAAAAGSGARSTARSGRARRGRSPRPAWRRRTSPGRCRPGSRCRRVRRPGRGGRETLRCHGSRAR